MLCYEHKPPVEKVLATIKIDDGHWRTTQYCPTCDNLEHFKFTCRKCKSKNDYWTSKKAYPYKCQICRDSGKIPKFVNFYTEKSGVPKWRKNMEDATPEEVMSHSYKDFGIQPQSAKKWKEYYANSQFEKDRERKLNEEKRKLQKEIFGSSASTRVRTSRLSKRR